MQLGWFPGVKIRQTSDEELRPDLCPIRKLGNDARGTVAVAAGFGSSDRLAGAYGTAVSTTMLLTTALLYAMRDVWRWPAVAAILVSGVLVLVDFAFFAANILKVRDGGWFPLLFGALVFMVMITWHKGMEAVRRKLAEDTERTAVFLVQIDEASGKSPVYQAPRCSSSAVARRCRACCCFMSPSSKRCRRLWSL